MEIKNILEFKGILVGMVLGDGNLRNRHFKTCSVIKEYAEWKKQLLEYLTSVSINGYINKSSYGENTIYEVRTKVHPVYEKLFLRMYHSGRKTIDKYSMNILSPLGILIWYLDDGCLDDSCGIKFGIYSNGFNEIEHQYIQKILNDRFNLRFNIRKSFKKSTGKTYYWLYLKASDRLKFWDLVIAPYINEIPEQIKYKIPTRESIESLMDSPLHKRFYVDSIKI